MTRKKKIQRERMSELETEIEDYIWNSRSGKSETGWTK